MLTGKLKREWEQEVRSWNGFVAKDSHLIPSHDFYIYKDECLNRYGKEWGSFPEKKRGEGFNLHSIGIPEHLKETDDMSSLPPNGRSRPPKKKDNGANDEWHGKDYDPHGYL